MPLPVRAAWRYLVTGKELWGAGDNATFLHDATVDYRGRPYETLSRARWRRVARRHATIWGVLLQLTLWAVVGAWLPLLLLSLLSLAGAAWGAVALWRYRRTVRVNRAFVDPAAETLCNAVGIRYRRRTARTLIELPRGFGKPPKEGEEAPPVRITIPVNKPLTAATERAIAAAVGGRLGIPDARGEWFRAGERMTVDLRGTPLPPAEVTYAMLRSAILNAPAVRPVIGMGAGGAVVSIDYEQDSPHVAISGAAGTGKTTLARLLLAQRMRHGNGLIVVDAKRWSHRWAHKLPEDRCRYAYRVQDMHEVFVALGEELERRINCEEEELSSFRTVDVVMEEANSVIRLLNAYWEELRGEMIREAKEMEKEEPGSAPSHLLNPPRRSPAVASLQYAVNMGREMRIHVHVMAQRLSASVFGGNGGDVRESFQLRIMAKWDRKLWNMLASGITYVAWPGGRRGVWGLVLNGVFVILRVPPLSDKEAVELATSGGPVYGPVLGRQNAAPVIEEEPTRAIAAPVPLSEAALSLPADARGDRLTVNALRMARQKDATFPRACAERGTTRLYDLDELINWRMMKLGLTGQEGT